MKTIIIFYFIYFIFIYNIIAQKALNDNSFQSIVEETINRFNSLTEENRKSANIRDIYIDRNANKWIGTDIGLFKVNDNIQEYVFTQDTFPAVITPIYSISSDNNDIWCAFRDITSMQNKMLCLSTLKKESPIFISNANPFIKKLLFKQNRFWIATNKGLFFIELDKENNVTKRHEYEEHTTITPDGYFPNNLPDSDIHTIAFDPLKKTILVGMSHGLYNLESDFISPMDDGIDGVDVGITAFAKYENEIYIALGKKIYYMKGRSRWRQVKDKKDVLKENEGFIEEMLFDKEKNLWIVAKNLIKYNYESRQWYVFNTRDGFPEDYYATCLDIDKNQTIWVGTDRSGLFKIEKIKKQTSEEKDWMEQGYINLAIYFKINTTDYANNHKARIELDKIVSFLNKNKQINIKIEGHTNLPDTANGYTDEDMVRLSKKRTEKVKEDLITKGLNKDRITTEGFGASQPIKKKNNAVNSRIEINILE